MKSLNIILVAVLAIIVTGFIFIISIADIQAPTVDDTDSTADADVEDTDTASDVEDDYLIFESEELGIRFQYPKEWDELIITVTDTTPSSDITANWRTETLVSISETGIILASSYTGGEIMGRGGYWADYVTRAMTDDQVNTLCNNLESPEFSAQPSDSCSNFTNLSGIDFVQLSGTTDWYGDITNNVDLYLAHHPDSDYYGIAISTQDLAVDGEVSPELADQVYRVVMSLEYID